MNEEQLLLAAIRAAATAGAEILDVYGSDFSVEFKQDRSPLTLADHRAHRAIVSALSGTGIPVLSEEGKTIPCAERRLWSRFWLVDPLDGTKEFVKRNGEFTVNIALIENRHPVAGVILAPVTGRIYFASVDSGAWTTELHGAVPASLDGITGNARRLPGNASGGPFSVVASRSHMSPETLEFVEKLRSGHPDLELVSVGSSLKLCLIAEGSADIYPRFGPTMEWDTAAGHAIVECSGGYLEQPDGSPVTYNKENLLNPWFIAGRHQ